MTVESPSAPLTRIIRLIGISAVTCAGLVAAPAMATVDDGADCIVPAAHTTSAALPTAQKDPNTLTAAQVASMEREFRAALAARGDDVDLVDTDPITIQVYIHVIRQDLTVPGGNVPIQRINDFMTYLNEAFHGTGHSIGAETPFTFELAGVDRTTNKRWYKHSAPVDFDPKSKELQMKTALREPGSTAETLNVYVSNMVRSGLYGIATVPAAYDDGPNRPTRDGVQIDDGTLPGGNQPPFNLGSIGPHEIGHWMGLYHVFQGGCTAPGDEVDDTPAMAGPSDGCPTGADTCASAGLDPIHNYLDYSDDACQNQYTVGQSDRMVAQWFAFRDGVG